MNSIPSPQELAREILAALEEDTMTSKEHIESLVREGIIDRTGRVICQKLFGAGTSADTPGVPEKNGQ